MKTDIHPKYFEETTVTCACSNTFVTGSTKQNIVVEVCYKCHPFYTGEQRFLDQKGQVDKFKKKQAFAKQYQQTHKSKKDKNEKKEREVKSLKELLQE